MWCPVLGSDVVAAYRLGIGSECAHHALGQLEDRLLAACSEQNRRCGCGGAGACTAAESDVALSRQCVWPLVLNCRSRSEHALRWGLHVAHGAEFGACGGGSPRGAHAPVSAWCMRSSSRIGCSRLAGNQVGAAGVEALARALPPGLMTLNLDSTFSTVRSARACLLSLLVWACAAVRSHVLCSAVFGPGGGGLPQGGGQCAHCALGQARGSAALGMQTTKLELRAWRRWRAHCRRV
jgi:hypothetical protein